MATLSQVNMTPLLIGVPDTSANLGRGFQTITAPSWLDTNNSLDVKKFLRMFYYMFYDQAFGTHVALGLQYNSKTVYGYLYNSNNTDKFTIQYNDKYYQPVKPIITNANGAITTGSGAISKNYDVEIQVNAELNEWMGTLCHGANIKFKNACKDLINFVYTNYGFLLKCKMESNINWRNVGTRSATFERDSDDYVQVWDKNLNGANVNDDRIKISNTKYTISVYYNSSWRQIATATNILTKDLSFPDVSLATEWKTLTAKSTTKLTPAWTI